MLHTLGCACHNAFPIPMGCRVLNCTAELVGQPYLLSATAGSCSVVIGLSLMQHGHNWFTDVFYAERSARVLCNLTVHAAQWQGPESCNCSRGGSVCRMTALSSLMVRHGRVS